ncbi:hypothetical protein D3C80_1681540 [compost metagenome]
MQVAHRIDVDVQADEAQPVRFFVAQFDLHLHLGHFVVEQDVGFEILAQVGIPGFRAFDQQAFEGQVKQFHLPATLALAQPGRGVELDTLETAAFVVIAHGVDPRVGPKVTS